VSKSSDSKIGKIVASYSPLDTCPDSCVFKSGGCYAWGLFYLRILGKKIEDGRIKARSLKDALGSRDKNCKVVRHRVAGDVVGDVDGTIEECHLVEQEGLINIGYTHDWETEVTQPLKEWFRASCNTLEEVAKAKAMGWSTTLAVHGEGIPKSINIDGQRGVLCPARHNVPEKKDITCNDCTLCKVTDKTKDIVVMFEVHGPPKTKKEATEKSVDINELR
tara:strand:- start:1580 stop:2239 length:660 start_codon:yes stop_codon:yes gene_type:complete